MSKNNQNDPQVLMLTLGNITASGTFSMLKVPKRFVVTGLCLMATSTLAASNSNYATVTLNNDLNGALAVVDTRASGVNGLTANVGAVAAPNAPTDASPVDPTYPSAPANSNLTVAVVVAGTVSITDATLAVTGFWL